MSEPAKVEEGVRTPAKQRGSAWPAGVACVCFCGLSVRLFQAYGLLHWGIIRKNYRTLDEPLKTNLFQLLGFIEVYHLTALLSVIFGIWAFRGQPRWIGWVCLALIPISFLMLIGVM